MAEKCTKMRDARAKLLFRLSKPIAFLPFSLRKLSKEASAEGLPRINSASGQGGISISQVQRSNRLATLPPQIKGSQRERACKMAQVSTV